ncbi:jg19413 [Pararge aegeria aegeria]|uniref:Jg19413 protein n=1 Tax=Pararge aegeria aegeria TaxID=348720 RepID=A0A8S4R940_9NEOP|nr:jg19413 [Pararge aegeria aegeria]
MQVSRCFPLALKQVIFVRKRSRGPATRRLVGTPWGFSRYESDIITVLPRGAVVPTRKKWLYLIAQNAHNSGKLEVRAEDRARSSKWRLTSLDKNTLADDRSNTS